MRALGGLEQLAGQRVAGLVVGDDLALVLVERGVGLHASDNTFQRVIEVPTADGLSAAPGGEDRGLVAEVGQLGAGEPAGLLGDRVQVDVVGQRLAGRVHGEDAPAAFDIRRRDVDLAVEAAGAQQRRVELLEQVGGRR